MSKGRSDIYTVTVGFILLCTGGSGVVGCGFCLFTLFFAGGTLSLPLGVG